VFIERKSLGLDTKDLPVLMRLGFDDEHGMCFRFVRSIDLTFDASEGFFFDEVAQKWGVWGKILFIKNEKRLKIFA
jgi:hypothetical protein